MMRYAAMAVDAHSAPFPTVAYECDAGWNHELLGEHEGGTAESVRDVRLRLAEQRFKSVAAVSDYSPFAVAPTMSLLDTAGSSTADAASMSPRSPTSC